MKTERKNQMKNQKNVSASTPSKRQKFPLYLTIFTWLAAVGFSVYTYLILRPYQHGVEWLGTPLFGLPLVAVLVTVYYLIVRKKAFRWTVHVMVYLLILLVVTATNLLNFSKYIISEANLGTFAQSYQSTWQTFMFMPLTGIFEVFLVFLGIHFSPGARARGTLFQYLYWTIVLFILTAVAFAFFYLDLHTLWQVGIPVGVCLVVWIGAMLVAYFGYRANFVSSVAALACWAWCMALGAGVSIIPGYFLLEMKSIPVYIAIGTIIFALLVTALRLTERQRLITR